MKRMTEFESLMLKAYVANVNMICTILKRLEKLEEKNERI